MTLKICKHSFWVWSADDSDGFYEDFRIQHGDIIMYVGDKSDSNDGRYWIALTRFGLIETALSPSSNYFIEER